ncbi:Outer membrane lipoprotein-sorting protein [Malonomonas rubra DSM 5091]|uniref:Outer membrane lipoprotein-sorting protein n=1 Tax=Malonomonas rubra DSM 5091 TaxID=1122189 RepID=A0A1M6CAE2_MALRU|nr:DUF4292 domain-containing protein [Malonomonas rubra]SHI57966.1 Outer membrane lipoprotein-sorting protein [Malonomonas rubra DSM 5091]
MRHLFALFLLLLISACAKPPQQIWTDLPSSDELLQRIEQTTGQVNSLDAAASVALTTAGKFFSSQQFLLLERPERLRTDILTGFGQLILQLTSDGEQLSVFVNTKVPGRFYRGEASPDNLARFTRIPLQPRELVKILLYSPPMIQYQRQEVKPGENNGLLLLLENSDMRQEVLFDAELRVIGCRYYSGNNLFLQVDYQRLDEEKQFPRTIRVELPEQQSRATVKFSDLKLNLEIPADKFHLQPPDGIPVEPLP